MFNNYNKLELLFYIITLLKVKIMMYGIMKRNIINNIF